MSLREINLPTATLLPSAAILGLGIYVNIFRRFPITNLKKRASNENEKSTSTYEIFVPHPRTSRIADSNGMFGIMACANMLPFFLCSYMPIEQNQFLYASVPIRFFFSGMCVLNLLARGRGGMSEEGFWEYVAMAVLDGVGAVVLGRELGRWDGRVPLFD